MTRYDLITFGENMIRLSTRNYERLEQAQMLDFKHGGAEANVAVGLARMEHTSAWVSRLADNPLGRKIERDLNAWGVDTSHIVWTNDGRIGTFFLEVGAPPRPSAVLYDRRDSTMSQMTVADFPWDVLAAARWLHLTGITTAISESCRALVAEAMQRARSAGLTVSYDVNYRARLWTPVQARAVIAPLCRETDVLFITQADAARVFDIRGVSESPSGARDEEMVRALAAQFARKIVVMTLNARGAMALDKANGEVYRAAAYPVTFTVDRVGAGDAFAAGFIAGYMEEGIASGLTMGNALAALKMTMHGDYALVTRAEVDALIAGGAGGISR